MVADKINRLLRIERILFALLLIAMSLAGAFYELYKGQMEGILLIALLSIYLLGCYGSYRLLLRAARRKVFR